MALGEALDQICGRNTNPTVHAFERKVCLLEGADAVTSASTGMGIIGSTLFAFLSLDKRVVSVKYTYVGTNVLFTQFLPKCNVDATLCETTNHDFTQEP